MFVDLRVASSELTKDKVGPIGLGEVACAWQIGHADSREELHTLIDQMWDAVEKKANELQGSKS